MHADSLLTQGSFNQNHTPQPGAPGGAAAVVRGANANRRKSPRYSAVNERLWIGWWADGEFVLVEAQLVNISEGGLLVSVSPSPAAGEHVWMRLTGSATRESLEAVVLESKWGMLKRRFSVRLSFHRACPTEFYEMAVYGESTAASRVDVG